MFDKLYCDEWSCRCAVLSLNRPVDQLSNRRNPLQSSKVGKKGFFDLHSLSIENSGSHRATAPPPRSLRRLSVLNIYPAYGQLLFPEGWFIERTINRKHTSSPGQLIGRQLLLQGNLLNTRLCFAESRLDLLRTCIRTYYELYRTKTNKNKQKPQK